MASACVATALLDHGGQAGGARMPQTKQLVVVEGSLVQSPLGVLHEMVLRAEARACTSIVLCFEHEPGWAGSGELTKVLDWRHTPQTALDSIRDAVHAALATAPEARVTLVVDSLDALLDATQSTVREAYALLSAFLRALPHHSRLVLGSLVDAGANAQTLASSLVSPQVWSGLEERYDAGPAWTHATLRVRLHPPALIRHLYKVYGLSPPTSSPALRRAALAGAGSKEGVGEEPSAPDSRFWNVLHSVAGRGPLGTGTPGQDAGWWAANRASMPGWHALHRSTPPYTPILHAEQVLGLHSDTAELYSTGLVYLELHMAVSSGKHAEELAACTYKQSGGQPRLALLALDMETPVQSAAPAAADPHASMVQTLPFNLGETTQQRARREEVALPYTYQLHEQPEVAPASAWRGSTGQSAIFFEPESDDDEDDDDPDDDLDL